MNTLHNSLPPDVDRGSPGLLIINWILLPACILVIAARIHTRLYLKRSAGWDDWCILIALALGILYAIIQTVQIRWGYGRHAVYLPPSSLSNLGWSNVFITDVNAVCLFLIRTSICIFLLRMTARVSKWAYPMYFAIFLNFLVMIGTLCLYAAMCVPLVGLWDRSVKADCSVLEHATPVIKALGALNVFVDVLCAVIPVVVIRQLQISFKSKVTLSLILLSCGAVTAACAIGRVAALPTNVAPDPTYDWVPVTYWQAAEQYGAMLFASLPAINQLQNHFRMSRSSRATKGSSAPKHDPEQAKSADGTVASKGMSRRASVPANARTSAHKTADVYVELSDLGEERSSAQGEAEDTSGKQSPVVKPIGMASRLSRPWSTLAV